MFLYSTKYELNRVYAVIGKESFDDDGDYKLKMLLNNRICSVLPIEIRYINGDKLIYADISNRESLLHYISIHDLSYEILKKLFSTLLSVSFEIKQYLLAEKDIVFCPDLIFLNNKVDQFEVLCIPIKKSDDDVDNRGLGALFESLLVHVRPDDERMNMLMYSLFELISSKEVGIKSLYDRILAVDDENTIEEEIVCEEEPETEEVIDYRKDRKYHVSLREILIACLLLTGLSLMAVWIYPTFT